METREKRQVLHHGPPHIANWYDALLLAVHGLREQRKGLPDLGLLARRDVVLLCELGLPLLGRRRWELAFRRLYGGAGSSGQHKILFNLDSSQETIEGEELWKASEQQQDCGGTYHGCMTIVILIRYLLPPGTRRNHSKTAETITRLSGQS